MLKQKLQVSFTFFAAVALAGSMTALPAHAGVNVPTMTIDGGPLGQLDIDGGLSGYGYAMTGTGADSAVGNKSNGIELYNAFLDVYKPTGLVQFFIRFLPNNSYAMGLGPSAPSITKS